MLRIDNNLSIGIGENSRSNRKRFGSGSEPLAVCLERKRSPALWSSPEPAAIWYHTSSCCSALSSVHPAAMPVPAVVGFAVAAAANTESGKKVMKQVEELPLLAARHASDAALQHGSRLPKIICKWYRKLSAAQLRGMILVAASAFTFSLLSTLIKYASKTLPSMETVFWRAFVAWLLNLVAVRVSGVSLYVEKPYRLALATRCVVGCCAMSLGFYAMQQMVLADASVLIFTSPVMTFFLGSLVLNEKIDAVNFGFALFSFVGVICVARPTFLFGSDHATVDTDGSTFVISCALLGAVGQAVVYVSMRRLQQVNYLVVINYFLLTSSVLSLLSLLLVEQKFVLEMSWDVWLAVLGTGFLGFVGQLFLTRGFQLESAGTASVMRYLDVVFVFVWDVTLLHERINEWSAVGALIICGSAISIAVRKMQGH